MNTRVSGTLPALREALWVWTPEQPTHVVSHGTSEVQSLIAKTKLYIIQGWTLDFILGADEQKMVSNWR